MTNLRITRKEMRGQVLDAIQKSQEAVTDAIRAWAEVVQSFTPSLSTASAPHADNLPTPGEVVADATTSLSSCWPHSASSQRTYSRQRDRPAFNP